MELAAFGFRVVGRWELSDRHKSGIRFVLDEMAGERVVYAFVVDGVTKYIGVCEAKTTLLRQRMSEYQSLAGAGQNRWIVGRVREVLTGGKAVDILALNAEPQTYRGLEIDLVKGLENPLIDLFKPEWNRRK